MNLKLHRVPASKHLACTSECSNWYCDLVTPTLHLAHPPQHNPEQVPANMQSVCYRMAAHVDLRRDVKLENILLGADGNMKLIGEALSLRILKLQRKLLA